MLRELKTYIFTPSSDPPPRPIELINFLFTLHQTAIFLPYCKQLHPAYVPMYVAKMCTSTGG